MVAGEKLWADWGEKTPDGWLLAVELLALLLLLLLLPDWSKRCWSSVIRDCECVHLASVHHRLVRQPVCHLDRERGAEFDALSSRISW